MSGLIDRLQPRTASADEQPRVLDIEGAETDAVVDALSSGTRRAALDALFEEPRTASELADRLDASVQNVHYHLGRLEETGLVEVVDTRYSEKGNEMRVYAPANDPIVLVGDRDRRPAVERSLSEVVGGVALLGVAALFVQWGAERLAGPVTTSGGEGVVGPAGYGTAGETLGWLVFEVVEPGVLFFVGCLVLLAVVLALTGR